MKHLGDVSKINGSEIPVVDVVTFGAPCQDLSVAGKRAGMKHSEHGDEETTRSGLFFEAVRIIKEMRENDKLQGRTDEFVRPRFGIYENVPGTFSSNSGKDFQAVLTEIIRIVKPDSDDVPMPEDGKWSKSGFIYGDDGSFSVAWRLHDAQWWGVPQRRKRVCVLADFNGMAAGRILFGSELRGEAQRRNADKAVRGAGTGSGPEIPSVSESVSGDSEQSGTKGQATAESATNRIGTASGFQRGQSSKSRSIGYKDEQSPTIPNGDVVNVLQISDSRLTDKGGQSELAYSIQGNVCDRNAKQNGLGIAEEVAPSLNEIDRHSIAKAYGVDCRNSCESEVNATLQQDACRNLNSNNVVRITNE